VKDCEDTHAWPIYCVSVAWREPLIFRGSSSKRPLADRLHSTRSLTLPLRPSRCCYFPFPVFHTASRSALRLFDCSRKHFPVFVRGAAITHHIRPAEASADSPRVSSGNDNRLQRLPSLEPSTIIITTPPGHLPSSQQSGCAVQPARSHSTPGAVTVPHHAPHITSLAPATTLALRTALAPCHSNRAINPHRHVLNTTNLSPPVMPIV
jgi:hypothetical protein